jgi:iron uptake system component EfeO
VRSLPRPALVLPLGLLVALAGCGTPSSEASADGVRTVTITMTDDACTAEPSSVPAGATTFAVRNTSAARVTEAEVLQDGRILGEKENLTPGLSGSFTLRLTAGAYVLACPNAATERSAFTVTAAAGSSTGSPAAERDLTKAVTAYQAYLVEQTTTLTASTRTFVAAVKAGQVDRARALYPRTRAPYERIEPVAESFGELDPRIDARENDVDPGDAVDRVPPGRAGAVGRWRPGDDVHAHRGSPDRAGRRPAAGRRARPAAAGALGDADTRADRGWRGRADGRGRQEQDQR